jgi:hypothetical protein
MLLVGPARLLHLHVEKRRTGAVTIFRAQRNTGSSADCLVPEAGQEAVPPPTHRNPLELSRDQVLCVRVGHRARLTWHARAFPAERQETTPTHYHASLK